MLLALIETNDFSEDPVWVSKKTGLKKEFVPECLERLHKLGCINRDVRGRWRVVDPHCSSAHPCLNANGPEIFKQYLDLLLAKLSDNTPNNREFNSVIVVGDPTRMEVARQLIDKFQQKLCRLLSGGNKSEVYSLSVGLVPLTKKSY
jgi:hypothetical protein